MGVRVKRWPGVVPVVVAVVVVLAAVTCAPGPRFGSLRFGPRELTLETRGEVFELGNGLRVALLPDTRTNLVRVDVRYRVGAAEDPPRRAGMAHLVEHLTFELRAAPGEPPLGAALVAASLLQNAFTSHDATHYYAIALAPDLPALLELEARRMNPRCDQLDEAVFLRERDVVLEEQAQRTGGLVDRDAALAAAVWGAAHPYARAIGSREIADVTLAEVCAFLDDHHAPDRATLVVTGNFDPAEVRRAVEARFGASLRRSKKARTAIEMPALLGSRVTVQVEDESTTARKRIGLLVSFEAATPADGDAALVAQDVGARYLQRHIASRRGPWRSARVSFSGGDRGRLLHVELELPGEHAIDDAIAAIHEAAGQLGRWPPWGFEVDRSERRNLWLRAIDAFTTRGELAAERLAFVAPAAMFEGHLRAVDTYDLDAIARWARTTVSRARTQVVVIRRVPPKAPVAAPVASAPVAHDVPTARLPVDPADAERPLGILGAFPRRDLEELTLANGLRVVLAHQPGALTVDARLVFPVGDGGEHEDARRASNAASRLRDDLSPHHEPYDLRRLDWAFGLGTLLSERVRERSTTFAATGAALFADWHVWRLFWRIEAGVYPRGGAAKRDAEQRKEIDERAARLRARGAHARLVSERLFGPGHYSMDQLAFDGRTSRDELEAFRERYYTPTGATLIVAGGFDPAAMRRHIGELFGAWRARPAAPPPAPARVVVPSGPSWSAFTDREAVQVRATVAVGGLPAALDARAEAARTVLLAILQDRLRAVREGQGASYGVDLHFGRRGDTGALAADARLDPHRAGRALRTMLDVIATLERADDPSLAADLVRARRRVVATSLAETGGPADLASRLEDVVIRGEPVASLDARARELAAVTLADVKAAAARDLAGARRVVVVSGPRDSAVVALTAAGVQRARIEIVAPGAAAR